jgi:hypothetical protein
VNNTEGKTGMLSGKFIQQELGLVGGAIIDYNDFPIHIIRQLGVKQKFQNGNNRTLFVVGRNQNTKALGHKTELRLKAKGSQGGAKFPQASQAENLQILCKSN